MSGSPKAWPAPSATTALPGAPPTNAPAPLATAKSAPQPPRLLPTPAAPALQGSASTAAATGDAAAAQMPKPKKRLKIKYAPVPVAAGGAAMVDTPTWPANANPSLYQHFQELARQASTCSAAESSGLPRPHAIAGCPPSKTAGQQPPACGPVLGTGSHARRVAAGAVPACKPDGCAIAGRASSAASAPAAAAPDPWLLLPALLLPAPPATCGQLPSPVAPARVTVEVTLSEESVWRPRWRYAWETYGSDPVVRERHSSDGADIAAADANGIVPPLRVSTKSPPAVPRVEPAPSVGAVLPDTAPIRAAAGIDGAGAPQPFAGYGPEPPRQSAEAPAGVSASAAPPEGIMTRPAVPSLAASGAEAPQGMRGRRTGSGDGCSVLPCKAATVNTPAPLKLAPNAAAARDATWKSSHGVGKTQLKPESSIDGLRKEEVVGGDSGVVAVGSSTDLAPGATTALAQKRNHSAMGGAGVRGSPVPGCQVRTDGVAAACRGAARRSGEVQEAVADALRAAVTAAAATVAVDRVGCAARGGGGCAGVPGADGGGGGAATVSKGDEGGAVARHAAHDVRPLLEATEKPAAPEGEAAAKVDCSVQLEAVPSGASEGGDAEGRPTDAGSAEGGGPAEGGCVVQASLAGSVLPAAVQAEPAPVRGEIGCCDDSVLPVVAEAHGGDARSLRASPIPVEGQASCTAGLAAVDLAQEARGGPMAGVEDAGAAAAEAVVVPEAAVLTPPSVRAAASEAFTAALPVEGGRGDVVDAGAAPLGGSQGDRGGIVEGPRAATGQRRGAVPWGSGGSDASALEHNPDDATAAEEAEVDVDAGADAPRVAEAAGPMVMEAVEAGEVAARAADAEGEEVAGGRVAAGEVASGTADVRKAGPESGPAAESSATDSVAEALVPEAEAAAGPADGPAAPPTAHAVAAPVAPGPTAGVATTLAADTAADAAPSPTVQTANDQLAADPAAARATDSVAESDRGHAAKGGAGGQLEPLPRSPRPGGCAGQQGGAAAARACGCAAETAAGLPEPMHGLRKRPCRFGSSGGVCASGGRVSSDAAEVCAGRDEGGMPGKRRRVSTGDAAGRGPAASDATASLEGGGMQGPPAGLQPERGDDAVGVCGREGVAGVRCDGVAGDVDTVTSGEQREHACVGAGDGGDGADAAAVLPGNVSVGRSQAASPGVQAEVGSVQARRCEDSSSVGANEPCAAGDMKGGVGERYVRAGVLDDMAAAPDAPSCGKGAGAAGVDVTGEDTAEGGDEVPQAREAAAHSSGGGSAAAGLEADGGAGDAEAVVTETAAEGEGSAPMGAAEAASGSEASGALVAEAGAPTVLPHSFASADAILRAAEELEAEIGALQSLACAIACERMEQFVCEWTMRPRAAAWGVRDLVW